MKRLAALSVACLVSAGCTPHISDAEASALAREVSSLLQRHTKAGPLPRESWPASVANLKPQAVYIRAEGLYITTSSVFVGERGVFVPNSKVSFRPVRGTDPQYEPVSHGIFVYRIAG